MIPEVFKFATLLLVAVAVLLVLDTIFDDTLTVRQKVAECSTLTLLLLLFVSGVAIAPYVTHGALQYLLF